MIPNSFSVDVMHHTKYRPVQHIFQMPNDIDCSLFVATRSEKYLALLFCFVGVFGVEFNSKLLLFA